MKNIRLVFLNSAVALMRQAVRAIKEAAQDVCTLEGTPECYQIKERMTNIVKESSSLLDDLSMIQEKIVAGELVPMTAKPPIGVGLPKKRRK